MATACPWDRPGGPVRGPRPAGLRGSLLGRRVEAWSVLFDGMSHQLPDIDPDETAEWIDSFDAVVDAQGRTRARFPAHEAPRAGPDQPGRLPGHRLHPLRQHHPPRPGAVVPRRRVRRAPHPCLHPLERRGHGEPRQRPHRGHRRPSRPPTPARPPSTRSGSTTSSGARPTGGPGTRSTSRATPPPASTPGPSSRAGSPRSSSTTSASRSGAGPASATPTPASCPSSGSTPRCRWASGPLYAIYQAHVSRYLHPARSSTPRASRVWGFVGRRRVRRARDRSAPSGMAGASTSTTWCSSSTATSSASTARSAATARSSRSSRPRSAGRAGT